MYQSLNSPRLKQLQDILTTYVMYNFDLGMYKYMYNSYVHVKYTVHVQLRFRYVHVHV